MWNIFTVPNYVSLRSASREMTSYWHQLKNTFLDLLMCVQWFQLPVWSTHWTTAWTRALTSMSSHAARGWRSTWCPVTDPTSSRMAWCAMTSAIHSNVGTCTLTTYLHRINACFCSLFNAYYVYTCPDQCVLLEHILYEMNKVVKTWLTIFIRPRLILK